MLLVITKEEEEEEEEEEEGLRLAIPCTAPVETVSVPAALIQVSV